MIRLSHLQPPTPTNANTAAETAASADEPDEACPHLPSCGGLAGVSACLRRRYCFLQSEAQVNHAKLQSETLVSSGQARLAH